MIYSFIRYISCPGSGYLTRQISFVLNNYVFHEGEDTDNKGLLIPRYKASGRTAPDGKVYQNRDIKGNEDDLVPVRSIVTKRTGDLNTITPDLIGKRFNDFTDGAAIGLSFSTSFTESTTQSALGLKHGGHERKLDTTGGLKAPKDCTFSEDGKWIKLKTKSKSLLYPRPDNLVTLGKDSFTEGEVVCYAYNSVSPVNQLNSLINVMKAKPNVGKRYYEKENVAALVSDCYALSDGEIKYSEDEHGNMRVFIDNDEYLYNPNCMYYYPSGTKVKKFDRICSGVADMTNISRRLKNVNDLYLIFRKQIYSLIDDDYKSTGLTGPNCMPDEIIELLFTGLTSVLIDPKTNKIDEIKYKGVHDSIMSKKSFYTVLSYGYSGNQINKAFKGELDLEGDVMSDVILGLLLHDQLDN